MGLGGNVPDGGSRHYEWFDLHDEDVEPLVRDNSRLVSGVVMLPNKKENKKRYPYYPAVVGNSILPRDYSLFNKENQDPEFTLPTVLENIEPIPYQAKPTPQDATKHSKFLRQNAYSNISLVKDASAESIKETAKKDISDLKPKKSEEEQAKLREARKRQRLNKKIKNNASRRAKHLREKKLANIANLWDSSLKKRILLIDADNFTGQEEDMIIYMKVISSLAVEADFAFLAGQAHAVKRLSRFVVGDNINITVVENGKDLADKFLINSALGITSKSGYDYVVASNDHIFVKLLKGGGGRLTILSPNVDTMSLQLLGSSQRIFDMKTLSAGNFDLSSQAETAIIESIKNKTIKKTKKSPKKGSASNYSSSKKGKPEVHSSRKHGNKGNRRIHEKTRIVEEELDSLLVSAKYNDFSSED